MSDNKTPEFLQDADSLCSDAGFATGDVWYHGTSSGLVANIEKQGLIGGGDTETLQRAQGTLGTIGNRQFESNDPVFLTQSKELAYYWAQQKTHTRNLYFQKGEEPVVFAIEGEVSISPDVGATAILLEPSNHYILTLQDIYERNKVAWEDVNPLKVPREFYLQKLGMAYSNDAIPAAQLTLLKGE